MKAVVSVTFDNEFVVHDIKVIESQNGMFIAMPSRKTPDGNSRILLTLSMPPHERKSESDPGKVYSDSSLFEEQMTSSEEPTVSSEE